MWQKTYTTYILTNANRSVLYTGVTNHLRRRLTEHWLGKEGSFTSRYQVYYLVWFEDTKYVLNAIALEKEIKDLGRQKKEQIIQTLNPEWTFRNNDILGYWPPTPEDIAAVREYQKKHPNEDIWE